MDQDILTEDVMNDEVMNESMATEFDEAFAAGLDEGLPGGDEISADAEDTPEADGEDTEENGGAADGTERADTTAKPTDTPEGLTTEAGEEAGDKGTEQAEKHRVKIRGKEQEFTLPEVLALASKGGDYDRIRAGYDELKAEAMPLRELAAKLGKTPAEVLSGLADEVRAKAVQADIQQLTAAGMDENMARYLAEQRAENRELQERLKQALSPTQPPKQPPEDEAAGNGAAEATRQSIEKLVAVYGVTELPEEVIKLSVEKGLLPFDAYQAWRMEQLDADNRRLTAELEQSRQTERAAAKSPGSMSGGGGADNDPFLAGFDEAMKMF